MTGPRSYSAATRAALAQLSLGRYYNPDCERPDPIIVLRAGEPYIDYEIAHIRDAEPGNRFVAGMTDAERRAFVNLVNRQRHPASRQVLPGPPDLPVVCRPLGRFHESPGGMMDAGAMSISQRYQRVQAWNL